MQKSASRQRIEAVIERARELGFETALNDGREKTVIAVLGVNTGDVDTQAFEALAGVEKVVRIMKPYKLASRDFHPDSTVVRVDGVEIGAGKTVIMAGPCAVETKEQVLATARMVKSQGATILRGGAFKPSTSPFGYRGKGEDGLKILALAKRETGLPIVTEVLDPRDVALVAEYADILQVGARNMQNFALLEEVGMIDRPVMLKRGLSATIEEWLQAADYILRFKKNGSPGLILCERGIRTFSSATRFMLDVSAVPVVKELSHLPVIIDPSHAAGNYKYVPALAKAGLAVGADGLLIEVHPHPEKALKDGAQSLTFSDFARLMEELKSLAETLGREI